jgi:hypothetical protein
VKTNSIFTQIESTGITVIKNTKRLINTGTVSAKINGTGAVVIAIFLGIEAQAIGTGINSAEIPVIGAKSAMNAGAAGVAGISSAGVVI